ncbi:MAG TPA: sulfite exporter TauE/SafE family protein [Ignavibacteriales bacterium]|nr:sulfite exporter TauE/SafE family protein [Ignavibacteriales bacterium]
MDSTILILIIIVLLGAVTQSLTGFGFALISVPLLSLFLDVKTAIALGALCGLVINILLFLKFKNYIIFREILPLMAGAFIGIPLGAIFLREAAPGVIKIILAFVVLIFAIYSLPGRAAVKGINSNWGYFFGLTAGILGGAFNTNGPPVLIYSCLKGWDKNKMKASLIGFFTFTSIVIVSSHASAGLITRNILVQFLYLLPVITVGIFFGNNLFSRISAKIYNKVIIYSLIVISLLLMFK